MQVGATRVVLVIGHEPRKIVPRLALSQRSFFARFAINFRSGVQSGSIVARISAAFQFFRRLDTHREQSASSEMDHPCDNSLFPLLHHEYFICRCSCERSVQIPTNCPMKLCSVKVFLYNAAAVTILSLLSLQLSG